MPRGQLLKADGLSGSRAQLNARRKYIQRFCDLTHPSQTSPLNPAGEAAERKHATGREAGRWRRNVPS